MSEGRRIDPTDLIYRLERIRKELSNASEYGFTRRDLSYIHLEEALSEFRELRWEISELIDRWSHGPSRDEEEISRTLRLFSSILARATALTGDKDTQIAPVSIYLETFQPEDVKKVEAAVTEFVSDLEFKLFYTGAEEWGSWFREFFARSKKAITSEAAEEIYERAERTVEMRALLLPQAQIDSAQADAAARLITSLDGVSNAVVQIGSVLLIKVDGVVHVRNLNQHELTILEHSRSLLKAPKEALEVFTSSHDVDQVTPSMENFKSPPSIESPCLLTPD